MAQSEKPCLVMSKRGKKLPKVSESGKKWPKTDQKCPKVAKSGQKLAEKCFKVHENGPK